MKKIIASICFSLASFNVNSSAVLTTELQSAVSCVGTPDPSYFYNRFTEHFGKPYRNEGGAYWWIADKWQVGGYLFKSRIKEVFVSSDPNWFFVGVVLEDKPEFVINGIQSSGYTATHIIKYNDYWVGADRRQIMWHQGRYTKLFCMIRNPFLYK